MSHNKETFESTTSRKVVAKQIDKVLASCLNQNGDDISVNFRLRLNDQIANSRKRKHRSKSGATVIVSSKDIHPMTLKSNVMTKFYKTLNKRLSSFQQYQSKLVELQNAQDSSNESSGSDCDGDSDSEIYSDSLDDDDEAEEEEDSDLDYYLCKTLETKRDNQSLQKKTKKRKIMSTANKSENNNNNNNGKLFDNDIDNADYMLYYNTLLHLTNKKHGIFSFISDIISIDIIKLISFQATGEVKLCNICNVTEIFILHDKRYTNNNDNNNNNDNLIYCNNCNILLFEFACCNGESTNKFECAICDEYYCNDCVSGCEGDYGGCDNSICCKCKEDDDENKNTNEKNNNKSRCDECGDTYCHRCLDGCARYGCDKSICRNCTSYEECGYCGHSWEGCSGCIAKHYRWCDSRHSSVDEDSDESGY